MASAERSCASVSAACRMFIVQRNVRRQPRAALERPANSVKSGKVPVGPWTKAKTSCSRDSDRDGLRLSLIVLKTLGEDAQREHFCLRHGLVGCGAISENSRKLRDFGEPAPVFFAFVLDREFHVSPRRLDAFYACSFLPPNVHNEGREQACEATLAMRPSRLWG